MNQYQKLTFSESVFSGKKYGYYDLSKLDTAFFTVKTLPFSIRILLENAIRNCDGSNILPSHIDALLHWNPDKNHGEVPFSPSRVVLQDFTGVPAILDLAAMRSTLAKKYDSEELLGQINPDVPVDLVIDHSVQVDSYGRISALSENSTKEYQRNQERYRFLNWAEKSFQKLQVVPPSNGIIHQINLEYLASPVTEFKGQDLPVLGPETIFGTDSHTTMINGLSVLGWGVGGIEAEAAMLGQPSFIPVPEVIGVVLTGTLPETSTATDLALYITKRLRTEGVVGKFVEFTGSAVSALSLADRATIANMAPEYGATCGFFPADEETLRYLRLSGREESRIALTQEYLEKAQLFQDYDQPVRYTREITIDLSDIVLSISGPKRPQDQIPLKMASEEFKNSVTRPLGNQGHGLTESEFDKEVSFSLANGNSCTLKTGSIVIASITSCTNTSNPSVMIGAGLLAKKAVEKGLQIPSHVKTSLSPGSKVVAAYLEHAGLMPYLETLGFHITGYGCMTCIGNSGPLLPEIEKAIQENKILAASVLSGNRNFEGRIHSLVKANYLASPPLVIAYALSGNMNIDLLHDPIGYNSDQEPVYLEEIWPTKEEIEACIRLHLTSDMFHSVYSSLFSGSPDWNAISTEKSQLFPFTDDSSYIKEPPFFDDFYTSGQHIVSLENLRVLAKFGDSITTDHISPAGNIAKDTPAASYLQSMGIAPADFNTYGSRRGNHEVMVRGTFANIRIRNQLVPGKEGGWTIYWEDRKILPIYDACEAYRKKGTGLVILAGKDYGMGSSRDWAAKGTQLLGVKAVIAESYERIHRSNLAMMGIVPLQFMDGENAETWNLSGEELFSIPLHPDLSPQSIITVTATRPDQSEITFKAVIRFDSKMEIEYFRHGGILPMVLHQKISQF